MLTVISSLFFFIMVIGAIIFLPVMIIFIKIFLALKNSTRQTAKNKEYTDRCSTGTSPNSSRDRTQYDDIIETTCKVVNE